MNVHAWVQRMNARRFDLALLPLSVVVIIAATVVPIDIRAARPLEWRVGIWDFLQNLLLFAPLGAALHRRSWVTIVVAPLLLSVSVEILQIWQFERFPSPFDVFANVLGAVIVASALRRPSHLHRPVVPGNGWLICACVLVAGCLLIVWQLPRRSSAIADWNEQFALLLGNEVTADRPWRGTIDDLAIWDRALTPGEIRALVAADASALAPFGLIYADPHFRRFEGGAPLRLPPNVASGVAQRVQQSGRFSIAMRIRTSDLAQDGPARIVSFSRSTEARNFDLGQDDDRIVFRVRNPVSGANGERVRAETGSVLTLSSEVPIVATYDGTVARIFIDGRPHGRANLAAAGCRVAALCNSALPLAWAMFGGAVSIAALFLAPVRQRLPVLLLCLASAMSLVALEDLAGLMPTGIAAQGWIPFSALLGGVGVGVAHVSRRNPGVAARTPS